MKTGLFYLTMLFTKQEEQKLFNKAARIGHS